MVEKNENIQFDELCKKALYTWLNNCDGTASIVSLQRILRLGFNRAGRIVESLEKAGYIESWCDCDPARKRTVLVTLDQLDDLFPDQSID